jgi:hypothetical protein
MSSSLSLVQIGVWFQYSLFYMLKTYENNLEMKDVHLYAVYMFENYEGILNRVLKIDLIEYALQSG